MSDETGAELNGRTGELVRWLLAVVVTVLVSYYTAALSMENRLTTIETVQKLQWEEVQRTLGRIEVDVREVKRTVQQP